MHIAYLDNNNIIYIEVPSLSDEIDDASAQLLAWQPLPPLPKQQKTPSFK